MGVCATPSREGSRERPRVTHASSAWKGVLFGLDDGPQATCPAKLAYQLHEHNDDKPAVNPYVVKQSSLSGTRDNLNSLYSIHPVESRDLDQFSTFVAGPRPPQLTPVSRGREHCFSSERRWPERWMRPAWSSEHGRQTATAASSSPVLRA